MVTVSMLRGVEQFLKGFCCAAKVSRKDLCKAFWAGIGDDFDFVDKIYVMVRCFKFNWKRGFTYIAHLPGELEYTEETESRIQRAT